MSDFRLRIPADPVWSHVVKTVVGTIYADLRTGQDLVLAVGEATVEAASTSGVFEVEVSAERSDGAAEIRVVGRGESIEYDDSGISDALIISLAPGSKVERAPNEYRYTIMTPPSG